MWSASRSNNMGNESNYFSDQAGSNGNVEYLRALKRSSEMASTQAAASSTGKPAGKSLEDERRRDTRYRCEGSVRFGMEGCDVYTWATVTDVSRGGCYVELQVTSPVNTELIMRIEILGIRFEAKGQVRVSYPFLGMGIAFTHMADHDRAKLEEILVGLSRGSSAVHDKKPAAAILTPATGVKDPQAALAAIDNFFQESDLLTRDAFQKLIAESQKSNASL